VSTSTVTSSQNHACSVKQETDGCAKGLRLRSSNRNSGMDYELRPTSDSGQKRAERFLEILLMAGAEKTCDGALDICACPQEAGESG